MRILAIAIMVLLLVPSSLIVVGTQRVNAQETVLKLVNPLTGDQWFNFTSLEKHAGDNFTINIMMENGVDIGFWEAHYEYNASLLEFVDFVVPADNLLGEGLSVGWAIEVHDAASSLYCILTGADDWTYHGHTGSGTLGQMIFKIKGEFGETDLAPCADLFGYYSFVLNSAGWDIPFTAVGGYFTYSPYGVYGDVNHDGKVDTRDVFMCIEAFNSWPNTPRWNSRADLDVSGYVNMRDVLLVVLNFNTYELR